MPQASGQRRRPGNPPRKGARKPTPKKKRPVNRKNGQSGLPSTKNTNTNKNSLSKLLSPENIQETVKSVGTLRTQVKKWMGYLQQADQVLDTVFFTTNSLRDTGVLDKLVKQRGKNLSTEDFTNILVALMNSPAGTQILKSMGSGDDSSSEAETPASQQVIEGQTASARKRAPKARRQGRRPGLPG